MTNKDSKFRTLLVWALVVLMIMFVLKYLYSHNHETSQRTYPEFLVAVQNTTPTSGIEKVTIHSDNTRGDEVVAITKDGKTLIAYTPADNGVRAELRKQLETKNIPINYEKPDESSILYQNLIFILVFISLAAVVLFFMRNMQNAGGKAFNFGKSRAKMQSEGTPKITFKDVAGIEEAKQECQEIVTYLKDPRRFQEIGARVPKGVLLVGPPGTGKTLLARSIAGESGVPFFFISGSDFVEMFVGVGASRVRDLFENAKKNAPCIIFIDEIDAVGRHRGTGIGGGHDEREQTLNQLLVEMDGFETNQAVIVIAATNRHDVLDPALLRPGRFDRRIIVGLPDVKGRKEILSVHLKKIKHTENINLHRIALGTPGFSGADLENLCNEAALYAARNNMKSVTEKDFEYAKDKILMGPERKSAVLPKETIRVTAYHEAGHALVSHYLKAKESVHKITVIPRGNALGLTAYLPHEDILNYSKEDLMTRICYAMGGRAAEDIKFSQFTTGASNDIQQATEIARRMVCQFGMSRLGPINFGQKSENPFLGRDWGEMRNYSESVANEIDTEISKIINTQYNLAKQILLDHIDSFERVATTLLELETLDSEEFIEIVERNASMEVIRAIQSQKSSSGGSDDNNLNSGQKSYKEDENHNKANPTPAPSSA